MGSEAREVHDRLASLLTGRYVTERESAAISEVRRLLRRLDGDAVDAARTTAGIRDAVNRAWPSPSRWAEFMALWALSQRHPEEFRSLIAEYRRLATEARN